MFFFLLANLQQLRQEEKKIALNPSFKLEEDFLLEVNKMVQEFLLKNNDYRCTGSSFECLKNLKGPLVQEKRSVILYHIFLLAQKYSDQPDCFFKQKDYVSMMQEIRFLEGTRNLDLGKILLKHQKVLNRAYEAFNYVRTHCRGKKVTVLK